MLVVVFVSGCAQDRVTREAREREIRLSPEVVQGAVTYEPGAKDGAVVPEISSPHLRAIIVEEKIENNRLVERHREWILEGEPQLLGIPKDARKSLGKSSGGSHEN